jgi:peptidoglycan/xylan/chitin deacetylase (PgdA/CDA1 family)
MFKALLVPMYHRVYHADFGAGSDAFETHIKNLAATYPIVVPGDRLVHKLSVCLTFDDAYVDFYYFVYPLLKKLNIKAVLAVSPKFILDATDLTADERLHVGRDDAMTGSMFRQKAPFCTWKELQEMEQSGHVIIASHAYSHRSMTDANTDFEKEVIYSKQVLEDKLDAPIDIFVYPFGDMNRGVHQKILKHYAYVMRIGSAINMSWQNRSNCIYRFDMETYWPEGKALTYFDHAGLYYKYWCNRIRKK